MAAVGGCRFSLGKTRDETIPDAVDRFSYAGEPYCIRLLGGKRLTVAPELGRAAERGERIPLGYFNTVRRAR